MLILLTAVAVAPLACLADEVETAAGPEYWLGAAVVPEAFEADVVNEPAEEVLVNVDVVDEAALNDNHHVAAAATEKDEDEEVCIPDGDDDPELLLLLPPLAVLPTGPTAKFELS